MPRIIVEATGPNPGFRITMPSGDREWIAGYRWIRKLASQVLNLAEHIYKIKRSTIRFYVK